MVPDLPCADGAPDNSEGNDAPVPARRLAPFVRRSARVALIGALSTAIGVGAGVGVHVPQVHADGLDDQKKRLQSQIAQNDKQLDDSNATLVDAQAALQRATAALTTARATLATTNAAVAAATKADQAAASKLKAQQAALAAARLAVSKGKQALAAKKHQVALMVSEQYQKQTNLAPFALLASSSSMADFQSRVQLSTTMLDTSQSQFQELTALQQQLEADEATQATLEKQVAMAKVAAAKVLADKQTLQRQAAAQATSVAALVSQRTAAQTRATQQVATDRAQAASLATQEADVEHRIAVRIAEAKAAAARKAALERARRAAAGRKAAAARQAAAAAKTAAARQAAQARAAAAEAEAGSRSRSAAASTSSHHGFIYPVNAPITSPYGMRFHPILHVWKLHDGTDFGAACGTPIKAAYAGTVEERYFNVGYGNRLLIDHGEVDGHYITTAYNHAIRYVVGVGQHVSQGQTIGYVGETGYATGCHLHLMVYKDGTMINPMTWY